MDTHFSTLGALQCEKQEEVGNKAEAVPADLKMSCSIYLDPPLNTRNVSHFEHLEEK